MKSCVTVLFLLSAILLCADVIGAQESCGKNEARAGCGAVCEPTCGNPNPQICPLSCSPNGCRCQDGFVRDPNTKECVIPLHCTLNK